MSEAELLEFFANPSREHGPRTLLCVAHPDDETIGAGARLAAIAPIAIIAVTDGAPRDPWFFREAGCADRRELAALRWRELSAALRAGGVPPERCVALGFTDQEAALHLASLAGALRALFEELRPEAVLTHPYEGGHPDHDATAFAAHAARLTMPAPRRPALFEMPFYHEGAQSSVWGQFAGDPGRTFAVTGDALARKRAMIACHRSQARVLERFPLDFERVRVAPAYDFCAPPPVPAFHYDGFGWPLTVARFQRRAARAWRELTGEARSPSMPLRG